MGLSDFFKKEFWSTIKKDPVSATKGEKNENKITKTSFSVKYEIAFKGEEHGFDSEDKEFKNKPCYKSKMTDGSDGLKCQMCNKIMELNKVYTRAEIEQLSMRLGYDTFANIGGTVDENGFPNCACYWKVTISVKK